MGGKRRALCASLGALVLAFVVQGCATGAEDDTEDSDALPFEAWSSSSSCPLCSPAPTCPATASASRLTSGATAAAALPACDPMNGATAYLMAFCNTTPPCQCWTTWKPSLFCGYKNMCIAGVFKCPPVPCPNGGTRSNQCCAKSGGVGGCGLYNTVGACIGDPSCAYNNYCPNCT